VRDCAIEDEWTKETLCLFDRHPDEALQQRGETRSTGHDRARDTLLDQGGLGCGNRALHSASFAPWSKTAEARATPEMA
jgi:hypothetical protein